MDRDEALDRIADTITDETRARWAERADAIRWCAGHGVAYEDHNLECVSYSRPVAGLKSHGFIPWAEVYRWLGEEGKDKP